MEKRIARVFPRKTNMSLDDAIKTQDARRRWIPVKERLPENIGLYLVIEKHWLDGSPGIKIAKWNTADWFTADRKSREITPRVTHWMPLPELPNEHGQAGRKHWTGSRKRTYYISSEEMKCRWVKSIRR